MDTAAFYTTLPSSKPLLIKRESYSFLAFDLGLADQHACFKIKLVVATLQYNCCKSRFHDVQVTMDVKPVDSLGKPTCQKILMSHRIVLIYLIIKKNRWPVQSATPSLALFPMEKWTK